MIRGGHTIQYVGVMDGLAKGGTVTDYSWQQGHGSAPHRQAGHCYLAGRSKLSPLISTVRSEENTSHQCIFIQPRVLERTCTQNMMILSLCAHNYSFWGIQEAKLKNLDWLFSQERLICVSRVSGEQVMMMMMMMLWAQSSQRKTFSTVWWKVHVQIYLTHGDRLWIMW